MANHKHIKPLTEEVIVATVRRTERVTPSMVRVTLGGDGLASFRPMGFDQWFRLFLTRDDQHALRLPTATSGRWYLQYLAMPKAQRPFVRNYTVRAFRPESLELDVDFVAHEDGGPASTFALSAQPGDQVGLLDQGLSYSPREGAEWTLLVGDESGLAAVAGICASLPADARGVAILEIPTAADAQTFPVPDGVELRWVVRDGAAGPGEGAAGASGPGEQGHGGGVPGAAALAALRAAELPGGQVYAYVVGESGLATGARRHLVGDRGVPKADVDFVGYWKHGRASA